MIKCNNILWLSKVQYDIIYITLNDADSKLHIAHTSMALLHDHIVYIGIHKSHNQKMCCNYRKFSSMNHVGIIIRSITRASFTTYLFHKLNGK